MNRKAGSTTDSVYHATVNCGLHLACLLTLAALVQTALVFSAAVASPRVRVERVPDEGLQPQVAVDRSGTVHLVYFKGDAAAGDLFYAKSKNGETSSNGETFSNPIRVNSVPGSAVAIGNIRGARIALGRYGQVFVVWNGSGKAAGGNLARSPMYFTRLNSRGTGFEPQRNLIRTVYGIDGGGGIAADDHGRVYVFWHAPLPGQKGEENRRVWLARSDDDGKSFEPERLAWDQPTGTCGCCSLDAHVDNSGIVYVLFRAAYEKTQRDIYLLESKDHGVTFQGSDVSKWNVGYCVMSSEAFASDSAGAFAAWETEKKVHFGVLQSDGLKMSDTIISPSGNNEKYPALAIGKNGTILVSWTEGMGWKRGGSLHWQLVDRKGNPIAQPGFVDGVPTWSLVAPYTRRDSNFVILY